MPIVVKDNRRRWDALVKEVRRSGRVSVEVGVFGDTRPRSGGGPTNAQLAQIHEFGVSTANTRIPSRSFIRSTIDKRLPFFRRRARLLGGQIVDGRISLDQALNLLGLTIASNMRSRIRAGIPPPLADSTIASKGSTKPLIDTSQLVGSITHKVVPRTAV